MQSRPSPKNRSLTSQSKPQNELALAESKESKNRLDRLLIGCYTVQKLYGRDAGSIESVNEVFHHVLGRFPADHVLKAFTIWVERSQEFPTPADIITIIKRKGKPPLSREMYIGICKKDGEVRTPEDWQYMRDYEAEQKGDDSDLGDTVKAGSFQQENIRLRQKLIQMRSELQRTNQLLQEATVANGIEPTKPSVQEKFAKTIHYMQEIGAPQEDIDAFIASSSTTKL